MPIATIAPRSFTKPVPASETRSRAQDILDANRENVERTIINGGRRELVRVLVRAQKQLEQQLQEQIGKGREDAWTTQDVESSLVMVRAALGQIAPRFRNLLEENDRRAREVGARNTAELLTHFEKRAGRGVTEGGVLRPLATQAAVAMKRTVLERHATSVDRYGRWMIGVMRRELQAGVVRGATFGEMTDRLVGKRGPRGIVSMAAKEIAGGKVVRTVEEEIKEGLFVRYRSWAERIVRTEGMAGLNEGAMQAMHDQRAQNFPDLKKKCVEVFDRRTAQDSYAVHGQVRALEEMFVDGAGRRYLQPPGRPNDRACTVPWRDSWGLQGSLRQFCRADLATEPSSRAWPATRRGRPSPPRRRTGSSMPRRGRAAW